MSELYESYVTPLGRQKLAEAEALGVKHEISFIQVGTGSAGHTQHSDDLHQPIDLPVAITSINYGGGTDEHVTITASVPSRPDSITLHEFGLQDDENDFVVIGDLPAIYVPGTNAEGLALHVTFKIILSFVGADNATVFISPEGYASVNYVNDEINALRDSLLTPIEHDFLQGGL